jgi:hypothetical protein
MVVWTVMPASACLLAVPATGQKACCRTMAQDCPPAGTTANGSCCQVGRKTPAVTLAPVSSFERSQRLAFVPTQSNLPVSAAQGVAWHKALESPPNFSPVGVSILRI